MVKAMAEMILSRDMSSNEHETNSTKKHINKSQEANSIVVELNRMSIRKYSIHNYFFQNLEIIWLYAEKTEKKIRTSIKYCTF